MKSIVIYGLGQRFYLYRKLIERIFDVRAYCDQDPKKLNGLTNTISREKLLATSANYDAILLTMQNVREVLIDFVDEWHIPLKNFILLDEIIPAPPPVYR